MRNVFILMCGMVMMSCVVFAEDITTETCADGAGTVIIGAVSGHKYCKSNKGMNWWNAMAWCDGIGRRLFERSDCACSATVSDCREKCPELTGASNTNDLVWTATPYTDINAYFISLLSGAYSTHYEGRKGGRGLFALCR